jgi:hypothetical protein
MSWRARSICSPRSGFRKGDLVSAATQAGEASVSWVGERIIYWTWVPLLGIWLAAFVLFPGFVAPVSPRASAAEVVEFYRQDLSRVRYSMILFNWFGVALIPILLLIAERMRGMAHRTPVLRYCVIGVAGGAPIAFLTSTVFWLVAAFRPSRSPDLTLLTNDLAWITFTCGVPFLIALYLFLALAIAWDDQPHPVFPRWVAWFNLAIALVTVPAAFAGLAKSGVFAWDGVVSFWVKNVAIAVWIVVMAWALRAAMARDDAPVEAAA